MTNEQLEEIKRLMYDDTQRQIRDITWLEQLVEGIEQQAARIAELEAQVQQPKKVYMAMQGVYEGYVKHIFATKQQAEAYVAVIDDGYISEEDVREFNEDELETFEYGWGVWSKSQGGKYSPSGIRKSNTIDREKKDYHGIRCGTDFEILRIKRPDESREEFRERCRVDMEELIAKGHPKEGDTKLDTDHFFD